MQSDGAQVSSPGAHFSAELLSEKAESEESPPTHLDLDAIAEITLRRCSRNDKALRALDISNALFSAAFFSELAIAMQHNTVLQELYLDNCGIDDEALRVLSKGIEQNRGSALRALSLENNRIKCIGIAHLAKALRGNSRWARSFGGFRTHATGPGRGLRYLSIKGNAVSAIGAKAISEALMTSDDSLERLSVEANQIDDWAVGWFALAVRNHNVLECLDLNRNPIGRDGVEELKCACRAANASLILLREVSTKNATPDAVDTNCSDSQRKDVSEVSEGEQFKREPEPEPKDQVREECVSLVNGERLTIVLVSAVAFDRKRACRNIKTCAFSRPGSASRRQGTSTHRFNGQLEIEEPAGTIMADSHGATETPSELGRPPSPGMRKSKFSIAALACSSNSNGTLRPSSHRAPLGNTSTYLASKNMLRDARAHPGERAPGTEEMESTTALAPPSRWRRKLSAHRTNKDRRRGSSVGGCGAVAAKSLRRARSCGMLLGPQAASGVYGCNSVRVS